jgi:hypothetical protein
MNKICAYSLIPLLLGWLFFLQGCVVVTIIPALISGIGSAAGYSILNTAHKTEIYPDKDVLRNAIRTLNRMGFVIIDTKRLATSRWEILAETTERKISIELECITQKTTKITVNVMEGSIIKDKSTAEAIIAEVEVLLKKEETNGKEPRNAFLFVRTNPPGATVRIMNIVPPFQQGIELSPGPYHLEISSNNLVTRTEEITLKPYEERFLDILM